MINLLQVKSLSQTTRHAVQKSKNFPARGNELSRK